MERKILHLDMDAFFAAIEERDDPSIKGKPVIVGAAPGTRGVVSTCNYVARRFGVRSAMSIAEAYRRCPQGVYLRPHFSKYKAASDQVRALMASYTDQLEFISLDEGYMDVTGSERLFGEAAEIAQRLKRQVYEAVGTTCSVGLGYSMMAAKLASEEKKPDGYFEIRTPADFRTLVYDRPIGVIYGVGKKTAARLHSFGIDTVRQYLETPPEKAARYLGANAAQELRQAALGVDKRRVTPNEPAKSIGKETTFQQDVSDPGLLKDTLRRLSHQVSDRLRSKGLWCQTVTLKIKFPDMHQITRAKSGLLTNRTDDIYAAAAALLRAEAPARPVRLIGVTASHLTADAYEQLSFQDAEDSTQREKKGRLEKAVYEINHAYGAPVLKTARDLKT